MSYQVNLWNGFDLIHTCYLKKLTDLRELTSIFSEKYEYLQNYAYGMKKLYERSHKFNVKYTLNDGISCLKKDFAQDYNYCQEFSVNLFNNIISPCKVFLDEQKYLCGLEKQNYTKIEKTFKDALSKFEKAKQNFFYYVKIAEEVKYENELLKSTANPSKDKQKLDNHNDKLYYALVSAKEAETAYKQEYKSVNESRLIYIESTKNLLSHYQQTEESFINFIKDILQKYILFQLSFYKSHDFLLETKLDVMRNISSAIDIESFVKENGTNSMPPFHIEYESYKSTLPLKNRLFSLSPAQEEQRKNAANFMEKVFSSDPSENNTFSNNEDIEEFKALEIDKTARALYLGKLNPDHKPRLFNDLCDKNIRLFTLSCFNRFRISGLFSLDITAFKDVGEVLREILDKSIEQKDYNSARLTMILSQTFYTTQDSQKVSLQSEISGHRIWSDISFWDDFFLHCYNLEINKQALSLESEFQARNHEERTSIIKNILLGQLLSITHNMLSFGNEKSLVKEFIFKYSKALDKSYEDTIVSHIDSFVYEQKNTLKDSFYKSLNRSIKIEVKDSMDPNEKDEIEKGFTIIERSDSNDKKYILIDKVKEEFIDNTSNASDNNSNKEAKRIEEASKKEENIQEEITYHTEDDGIEKERGKNPTITNTSRDTSNS